MSNFVIKDLDQFIDVTELEKCHLEICAGIARSKTNLSSRVIPHYEMQNQLDKMIDFKTNEPARIGSVANEGAEFLKTAEELNYFNQLTHEQKKKFLQLYKEAYCDGEFVRLKFTKQESMQHPFATFYDSMCEWHPNSEYFPNTVKFIKGLPFKEIGRVLFFVSYHYLHTDVHYDRKDDCFDGKHHFIWMNPFAQKEFFLIGDSKEMIPLKSKAAFFNTRFLHGAKASKKMTYSLRVDGQLEEGFCQKADILWNPR